MTKEFNLWVVLEEIDQDKEDNGKDTTLGKIGEYKTLEEAEKRASELIGVE